MSSTITGQGPAPGGLAYPAALLGDPRWIYVTRVRLVMTNLPALDVTPSLRAFGINKARVQLVVQNVSQFKGYFSHEPNVTTQRRFTIQAGAVLNAENAPISPANALYVAGDAGCVLEAYEVVRIPATADEELSA